MQNPPLPQGDSDRPHDPPVAPPDEAASDHRSTVVRPPAVPANGVPSENDDVLADLFNPDPAISDESPTVISKNQPQPVPRPDEHIADSLRGRRLAHFELLEPIGVGGMAAVIRARDTQLDRPVALKVLPPEMADDPENVRRFHQEARSAAKLDHENIARVFFCGEDQKLHFIAFEFVEGENLRTILERRGRLPVQEALHYMLQIATGLAHAAARGVVHRDIKPSNIIITPTGRAKLVDMGLARMSETQTDLGLTQSGVTLGTFDYISPEQALEPRDADVRSDIYSLGCTFYHVLTGQPPVPEGTAAKKLHHHQHEAPLDPRQLNAEIPDEVAAILARMMAKDPRARYQRAEHLVQHLLLVAEKTGTATAEQPNGVLFVDAPLPDPPRTRPLLVAGLAAMILLVVILFFGRSGSSPEWTKDFRPPKLPANAQGADSASVRPAETSGTSSPASSQGGAIDRDQRVITEQVATVAEWLDVARKHQSDDAELEIVLTGPLYELPLGLNDTSVATSITLSGRKVTVRGKDPKQKPIVRFTYDVQKLGQLPPGMRSDWLALFLESDDATIQDVRFELDGRGNRVGRMAGIVFRGGNGRQSDAPSLVVRGCEFIQADQPEDLKSDWPGSLVLNLARQETRTALTVEDCYFVSCQKLEDGKPANIKRSALKDNARNIDTMSPRSDAITLKTPADLRASNCAFGPHPAIFRIEPGAEQSKLTLRRCAGLLYGESAAFYLAGQATCSINMKQSYWAGLNGHEWFGSGPLSWRGAVLIRQERQADQAVLYRGDDNRFYRLDDFWVRPNADDPEFANGQLKSFQEKVLKAGGQEDSPSLASETKFLNESDPLAWLERGDPKRAFQLDERSKPLRTKDGAAPVGLLHCAWGNQGPFAPLENKPAVAGRKVLIVDPTVDPAHDGIYKNLSGALADVNQGEEVEIQLRFKGPQPMSPVMVDRGLRVTIRPFEGSQPVLLVEKRSDKNSYLFRILAGEVNLENLEFRLQPDDSSLKSQAVAEIIGDGRCWFRKCLVTLDAAGKGVPLAVAAVSDPEAVQMRMGPAAPQTPGKGPWIGFENCLVRGEGDLVISRAGRPFELEATNTWAALAGSLLNCEGAREESPAATEQSIQVRLQQVTAYLLQHLVRIYAAQDLKNAVPVQVESKNCLFQATGGKSLVHLEGPDPGEDRMRSLVQWKPEHNAYGVESLVDNQPPNDEMPGRPVSAKEWQKLAGELNSRFSPQMPILQLLRTDLPLTQALPQNFRLRSDLPQGFGAVADALPLPTPSAVSKSEE
jgi:serine/threonine protein kinase